MKLQKRHRLTKGTSKTISWLLLLLAVSLGFLTLRIEDKILYNFNSWFIPFAIIGSIIGIVQLFRYHKIKKLEEYIYSFVYIIVHSFGAMLIGAVIIAGIELANFYFPTNNPTYQEAATVINKYLKGGRYGSRQRLVFHFENEKIKDKNIGVSETLYNQAELGDTYTFTLQNGFFNIPVIKDKARQEKGGDQ